VTTKTIGLAAAKAIFTDFDEQATAALLAEDYIQHNPGVPTGAATILGFLPGLKASGISSTIHRVIAEDDIVVIHNTYENAQAFGAPTLVGFDVFRVQDGKVGEHWDNLMAPTSPNPSGRTLTDGPTEVTDLDKTAANKALVSEFANVILLNGNFSRVTEFVSTDDYRQHNPLIGDGLAALGEAFAALAAQGQAISYSKIHRIVAEGNFVFVMAEGTQGETPTAYFDLFRVADGLIVEHWDIIAAIPSEMAHANGKF
jgi:predicted SnoaL-like aldol condensation-catalyzing enzyme